MGNTPAIKKTMITSRAISELEPVTRARCEALIKTCALADIDLIITCTYRDDEAQNKLYASGRTEKGRILTNLKGGQSKHNKRKAFDFCVMKQGKCDWQNIEAFTKVGLIGEQLGLLWAGRWRGSLRELCHFETN